MKQVLRKTFTLKALMFVALLVGAVSGAWADETSTLNFTGVCGGSGTADDGAVWAVTSDGTESSFDNAKGIHYGTGKAAVQYITLSTSDIEGTISEIVVNASGASGVSAVLNVTVGGNDFGTQGQSVSSSAADYTFTGSASGEIVVTLTKSSSATKALYVKSIAVTYGTTTDPSDESVATTVTIDATGMWSLDLYEGIEGSVEAYVYPEGSEDYIEGAAVTWESLTPEVLSIDANGNVTLLATGTATIKASYAGVENQYKSSSATWTFEVTNSDPNQPGTEDNPYTVAQAINYIKTLGSATSPSEVYVKGIISQVDSYNSTYSSITYWISDDGTTTNQMEVYSGKGINGAAFSNVSDLQKSDEVVVKGYVKLYGSTYEFDKNNQLVSLKRAKTNVATINGITPTNVLVGDLDEFTLDATFADGLTEGDDYEVTWSSSNPSVLEVAGSTYEAKAAGEAIVTIHVTVLDDETYNEVEESFTVTVKEITPANLYALVTSIDDLTEGDKVIIANTEFSKALSTTQNSNNRGEADLTISDGKAVVESDGNIQVFTIESAADNSEKYWYFKTDDGYIGAASSSSNWLRTSELKEDKNKAEISITSDGTASIVFKNYNRNYLQYNTSSSIFSCYGAGNSQKAVELYKQLTVAADVTAAGYATFSSTEALDFTNIENIYAYTASVEGDVISFTRINKVPAGTGVLLRSVEGGAATANVPVVTTAPAVEGNALVAVAEAQSVETGNTNYILNQTSNGVGFYQAAGKNVGAGKAYLHVAGGEAKSFAISFNDIETAITGVKAARTDAAIYNLAGQRVSQPVSGLYIVGGRKVLVK